MASPWAWAGSVFSSFVPETDQITVVNVDTSKGGTTIGGEPSLPYDEVVKSK